MAIDIQEKHGSGALTDNAQQPTAELEYVIHATGGEDEAGVIAALESTAPTSHWGLQRMNVAVEPMEGEGFWHGRCSYGMYEWSHQFDTCGGTRHVIASKSTLRAYGTGATTADNGNLIGVTGDNVEGCDITIPVYSFSETHYIDDTAVTATYKSKLFGLTGKVNNAGFKGFGAGEVLFMGASGQKRCAADWEITFHFQASPNCTAAGASALTIGTITAIEKKGWEYLWVRYKQVPVGGLKLMGQQPVAVYIEKVYDEGNFADLLIGT